MTLGDSDLRSGADENETARTEIQPRHRIVIHYDVKMLHFAVLRYSKTDTFHLIN